MRIPGSLIRFLLTPLNGLRLLLWSATGRDRDGVHAVPLTAAGKVVLVRLTYARGWRLPGGGRKRGESQIEAMLRELREEIGLIANGAVEQVEDVRAANRPGDRSALFLVSDVVYRPRRSLEIDEVGEFDPADLPGDAARSTREILEALAWRRTIRPTESSPRT